MTSPTSGPTSTTIRYEKGADGVVDLVLDDPTSSANTMSAKFAADLVAVLDRLEAEEGLTGVVLSSAKKTFFAGGNLNDLVSATPETAQDVQATTTGIKACLRRLETLGTPVAAAIGGAALGGGLELALAAHHRVVLDSPRAKLGFPEVTLGLLPGGGGVVRSVRLLGLVTALTELLLQGQQVKPAKALELGLVHALAADPDDLLAQARAWVLANPEAQQPYDVKGYRVPGGLPSSPALAQVLPALPAQLALKLKGAPYPAPHHIVCAAAEGLHVDLEAAFAIEGRYFLDLVVGQTSHNMIQALWFDLNTVNGGASRPTGPAPRPAVRVGVLGAGMMGAGIAHVCAEKGIEVVLKDVTVEAAEKGLGHVRSALAKALARGSVSQETHDAVLARITTTGDAADLAGCDTVIEAVFEDAALKQRVLAEAEAAAAPDALLASNTSSLPIAGLAAGLGRPADTIGMHFFSPVKRMPLVEIVVAETTSEEAVARAYDLVRQLGKTPIVVKDSRGFFTTRVFATLVLEGAALCGEGLAPTSVERAALQSGFPAGPLTLLDEVTLTLPLKAQDEARDAGMHSAHPGTEVLRAVVAAGRSGRAGGTGGFFDWDPAKRVWPGLAELFPRTELPFQDVKDRLVFAMAVEALRCLEERVVTSVEDANVGSILGIGFPPLYGGVLQFVDQYAGGAAGFAARAEALADAYGERFRPPALLQAAAEAGSVRAAVAAGLLDGARV